MTHEIADEVYDQAKALVDKAFMAGSVNGPQSTGYYRKAINLVGGDEANKLFGEAFKFYSNKYPQGWSYYPGDICPHGMYVGGCGADHICGYCEDA